MTKKFYVLKDGKESGPVSAESLKQKAADGELLPDDHIRPEGQKNWTKAAKAKGLFPEAETSSTANSTAPQDDEPLNRNHSGVFTMEDDGIDAAVKSTMNEFKSLDYGYLIPFKKIFSVSLIRKKAVRWVLAFGLFPMLFLLFGVVADVDFETTSFCLGVYFCMFWATCFHVILKPEGKVWRRGIKWAAFTATIGVVIVEIAQTLPGINTLYFSTGSESFMARLLGCVLGIGILEETCKALPFMLFVLRKKEVISLKTGIFLGVMSGFGFAIKEGMDYSGQLWLHGGAHVHVALIFQIIRFMTLPLLHGCWTGVVGWFAATASQRSGSPWMIMVVGILFMAVLHGGYDAFVFNRNFIGLVGSIGLAAISILVFMGYLAHGKEHEEILIDQPSPEEAS